MKLGFYLFAEYINMFMSSVLMATLYFGGYDIPFVNDASLIESMGMNGNYEVYVEQKITKTSKKDKKGKDKEDK